MIETYIKIETATLAKEKGFDWKCQYAYDRCNMFCSDLPNNQQMINYNSSGYMKSAPTQTILQKWFREIHKLNVFVLPNRYDGDQWYYVVGSKLVSHEDTGMTYEQALEKGLLEALKTI